MCDDKCQAPYFWISVRRTQNSRIRIRGSIVIIMVVSKFWYTYQRVSEFGNLNAVFRWRKQPQIMYVQVLILLDPLRRLETTGNGSLLYQNWDAPMYIPPYPDFDTYPNLEFRRNYIALLNTLMFINNIYGLLWRNREQVASDIWLISDSIHTNSVGYYLSDIRTPSPDGG